MDTREYMRNLLREQRSRQELELREQEAKRLEDEHWVETRKLKEELSVIAAPSGWLSSDSIGGDIDRIQSDMVDGARSLDDAESANTKAAQDKEVPNEKELKQGLREIWINEDRPEMKMFFPDKLKKYINKEGSPITAVYTAGKDAGIGFKLSTGTTGNRTKKTISNYVSEFKKTS